MDIRDLKDQARQLRYRLVHVWNTSLQIRVIGSIFVVCAVVVFILGLSMISIMTQRLVDAKLDIANSEIYRARMVVEQQIAAVDSVSNVQTRLNSAHSALATRSDGSGADTSAVYEPVLVVNDEKEANVITSPQGYYIPQRLRHFVGEGQISYQFAMVTKEDNTSVKSLIIGTPTDSDIPDLQVYLVLSMENEEQTLALMRGLFSAGGIVLLVLLVGISWLLTQQITGPVRAASRIAQRFADGHFRERMVVRGEDEMARMAMSFNTMAEELSTQIDQLKEYGDLQRQFTSDVSHELSTPLTSVRMAADLIASQEDELDPMVQRASAILTRELDRFEALLKDLLEISKHDAGVATLSAAPVDMRAVVVSAWKQVKHLAEKVGVPVRFELPEEPVKATVEARRIERILRNLVANAIDHSEGKPVLVRLHANTTAVAIGVYDNGVGLKAGQEELVFERFWRADPSRKRHSGGTGLGLAMAREDAVLHGGRLDVTGHIGEGTMFRLTLPREPHAEFDSSPLPLENTDTSISFGVSELVSGADASPSASSLLTPSAIENIDSCQCAGSGADRDESLSAWEDIDPDELAAAELDAFEDCDDMPPRSEDKDENTESTEGETP